MPDAATWAYDSDKDSHVISLTYKHGSTTIGNLVYTYDPDARRSTVGGSVAAVYIPLGNLCAANTFNAANEMTQYNGVYGAR